jgi:hypothetical protein
MSFEKYISSEVIERYEVHDYGHAAAILANEFEEEFSEIIRALNMFQIKKSDLLTKGGNESNIPKMVSEILRPLGWVESQLNAKMVVDQDEIRRDTHKIDYIKKRVAFDLEWNSKDQTFDRDLFAFRTFHEFKRISVGVLLTRSDSLRSVFSQLDIKTKYGASTTTMKKLLPRLDAGRHGGCPILVFGITPKCVDLS